ncbi:MAG: UbiA family prenyltransferase [Methermicoccaceae archaeon]
MRAYLEMMRLPNCVMAAFAVLIGALVGSNLESVTVLVTLPSAFPVLLGMVAVILITGAGNTVNDLFDIRIDKINRPSRPLPSGRVSPRGAILLSALFFLIGIIITLWAAHLVGYGVCIIIAVVNSVLLVSYAKVLKRMPLIGNLTVSYLTASTFLYGASLSNMGMEAIVLFSLALLATLTIELVKSVEDVEGDRVGGARTLAVIWGERRTTALARLLVVVAVLLSPLPFVWGGMGVSYLAIVLPADILFAYSITCTPAKSSKWLKVAMGIALVAFLVGAVV